MTQNQPQDYKKSIKTQKAEEYNTKLHFQSTYFASTKTCYVCNHKNQSEIVRPSQVSFNLCGKFDEVFTDEVVYI